MYRDPIVEEVRKVRDRLARAFDYDIDAIFAELRKREAALGDRLIRPDTRPKWTTTRKQ